MKNSKNIIDGNNYAYRAYFAYSRFSHKGKSTSVLYGFIQMLQFILNNGNETIVVWDKHRDKHRLDLLPEYKSHRSDKLNFDKDDFFRQKDIMIQTLFDMGIPQVMGEGEGDDMIYVVARSFKKCCIYSADKDFNQLLVHKSVSIFNPNFNKSYNYKTMDKFFNYKPEETVDYLSLLGDSSDNIPGYKGMGPVKIRKFLDEFGSIKNFLSNKDNKFSGINHDTLLEVYKRNRILIDLAYFYKRYLFNIKIPYINGVRHPKYKEDKFIKFCNKYNLQSVLENKRLFKQLRENGSKY